MTQYNNPVAPPLGELERQVMELLWESQPRSVRDVMNALPQNPAYTTIATVLQNLKAKEMVTVQRDGRYVFYLPLMTCDQYIARQMHQALSNSRDTAASMLHFVEDLPEEGLEMLRNYLDQT